MAALHNGIKAKYPRIYKSWISMRSRCLNPNDKDFLHYGGRGIKICSEWADSKAFIDWALSNGYDDNLTIDRIDVDGDYCPKNCRWADAQTQERNKRVQRNNALGVKGIHIDRGLYRAIIYANNKRIHLGRFATLEEAIIARKNGELLYWGSNA